MPTINLTAGCAIGCVYCYAVGYGSHPDEGSVVLYEDTLERLKRELPRKRKAPRSVFFSPSSDIFQPVAQCWTSHTKSSISCWLSALMS